MRVIPVTSFEDLQALHANQGRADAALATALTKGHQANVQAALRSGASPLTTVDSSGTNAFLLAANKPNSEELWCELLNVTQGICGVVMADDGLTIDFGDERQVTLKASSEQDAASLGRLCRFLKATMVWKAHYPPRENETNLFHRMREANHRLVEGARTGNASTVEAALAEGATPLAMDIDGKSVLVWATEHPNHAQLMGAILANDPSLDVRNGDTLCSTMGARTTKGGTVPYLPSASTQDSDWTISDSRCVPIHPSLVNSTLQAHLRTRDELQSAMGEFLEESHRRGSAVQLQWPNTVQFQRLLNDRFEASLAALEP